MANKPKPLILVVHGAWHQPAHYAAFVSELESRGFPVQCPRLPSSTSLEATFDDDVRCIREVAFNCTGAGHDVVGLMHSYGGKVGTRAFSGLGTQNTSSGSSETAAVRKLIYLAAFMPPQTGVLDEPLEGNPNPPSVSVGDDGAIQLEPPEPFFYNDLSASQQEAAVKLLVPHTVTVRTRAFQPLDTVEAAWWKIPVTQIICDNDQALIKTYQERMGDRVRNELNGTAEVTVEHFESGHSPFLNVPGKLADVVERMCVGGSVSRLRDQRQYDPRCDT